MPTLEKPNYILVDFENTQELDVQSLAGQPVHVVIFCGQNQNPKIPFSSARGLHSLGPRVEFVDSVCSGENSLDFQMAYYAGRLIERDPNAFIHFISKDKGFDSVVTKIKADKRNASRADSFARLPFMKSILVESSPDKNESPGRDADKFLTMRSRLEKMPATNRPRKRKTLASHIKSQTDIRFTDEATEEVIQRLIQEKTISVGEAESISYYFESHASKPIS